jgi:hypothetical protein
MTKNKTIKFRIAAVMTLLIALICWGFKSEDDPLHKRTFTIGLSETKNGVVAKKVINDRIYFKNGKLFSDFLERKFGYKWLRYRINKDSIFTDSTNTEVRLLLIEVAETNEENQTVYMDLSSQEWDLDGTIKITKNDKLRRYYDLAGREKGGKPKKIKTNKKKLFEIKDDSSPEIIDDNKINT